MNMHTTIPSGAMRRARLAKMFAAFERDDIEEAVDMLIDMLDAAETDPDLEDDEREPETDGPRFEILSTLPLYGIDQTKGPINEREAHRQRYAEILR